MTDSVSSPQSSYLSNAPGTRPFDSILIVRLSAMGDVIHTLPAAMALRRAFPKATLGWLIEERWVELLCSLRYPQSGPRSAQRPLVDRVYTVNTAEWRRSLLSFNTWQQIAAGLSQLRGNRYDAVIDFQGAIRSAVLARWSGARVVYGDSQPRENPAALFYSRRITAPKDGTHVIEQANALAEAMIPAGDLARANISGLPSRPDVEFPVDADAEKKIAELTAEVGDFVILNPGAGWGAKMWPVERYGQVAYALAAAGLASIVNCGPGEDELGAAVVAASGGAARKISCSISELIALTRRASLFIGGDTGPMHLAAALKIPVVGIFGPTNPARNGPFGTQSIVLRSASSVTDHSRYGSAEQGLLEITSDEVAGAARKLLECDPARAQV